MKNKKRVKNEKRWNIVEDLKRCLNIFSIFYYINEKQQCVASEIIDNIEICKATLYKYFNKASQVDWIDKENNTNMHNNGAHFTVVARPELKNFLKEFNKEILEFSKNLPNYSDNF